MRNVLPYLNVPSQLSTASGSSQSTNAVIWPVSAICKMSSGQTMLGGELSGHNRNVYSHMAKLNVLCLDKNDFNKITHNHQPGLVQKFRYVVKWIPNTLLLL